MLKVVRNLAAALSVLLLVGLSPSARAQEAIVNGTFNTSVADWSLDPGYGSFQWSPDGSLLLTNDAPPPGQTASVSQCDSITGGLNYDASVRFNPVNFIGGPQTSGPRRVEHTGTMYVLFDFFPLGGCRGSALAQFVRLSASGKNGVWESVGETFLSPPSAVSVLVSLAILKNQDLSDLQGYFDDVSLFPSAGPPPPPVASFSWLPGSPGVGQAAQFIDSSSGAPTSWVWNFGDPASGGANGASVQNPAHIYGSPGSYSVMLTATNGGGSGSKTQTVTVVIPRPVAAFAFTPQSPAAGQPVQFTDASSGSPTSWGWNFGDPAAGVANTSTLQNPTHVFSAPGIYGVSLTVTAAGGTAAKNQTVTVVAPALTASFSFTPPSPAAGQEVRFTDSSLGPPTSWLWNFGDPDSGASNNSTLQNPSHVFSRDGTYGVTLTVGNGSGSKSVTIQIEVKCVRCPRVVPFR
jgi:PKD repeat protein